MEIQIMQSKNSNKMNSKQVNEVTETYITLSSLISESDEQFLEINLVDGKTRVKLPKLAIEKLNEVLKEMIDTKSLTLDKDEKVLTTQQAANIIGCSRPHLIKLLESDEIKYYKVGKHRRILEKDVKEYRKKLKLKQKSFIEGMMKEDEELGLYD